MPYFIAVSVNGTNCNVVLLRLDTRVVLKTTITLGAAPTSPTGGTDGLTLGQYSFGGFSLLGSLAAAMVTAKFFSIPQLLAWAQDPWSFWYPRRMMRLVGISAAPALVMNTGATLPMMGV